ncbi:wax ester/triacylglycerol synthase family O-acyltransferase [Aquabacterium sp. OR-4]|uniref:wax ester/triacylglycerol synthase family O-acyltransferase n=1 Tax=Aquabacterium sp. OR-4 TaxID=2978127 RepID=UPI0028C77E4E|nr:wax ester/triacylglycerol synthase family O-acyltransferase [Aquabacterium sp. OR-4]MDT7834730.1 wax ester/triacylglycerol synthase family O-acyltransferase [Aquabacterium sp. OR-4]
MKQLSGLDATFLFLETEAMPMHVGSAHVFELPPGTRGKYVTRLRQHLAERLPLAPVLRRRLWWMPLNLANPAWVDAEPDLSWHVVELKLPEARARGQARSTDPAATMAAFEKRVGELHALRLDRTRPLWRMHVIEGLPPGPRGERRVGVYTQLHHAAVDGQAAVALAGVLMDLHPEGRKLELRPSQRRKVFELGSATMLRSALANEAAQVLRIVKGLPGTVGTLAGAAGDALRHTALLGDGRGSAIGNLSLAPRTLFNVNVGTGRSFAGLSLPLSTLKEVAHAQGVTLNDLVLYLCSTALRRYLAQHDALPRKSLIAAVPVTLREKGDASPDNQASMSQVSLGTHLSDPRRRLAHIKAATTAMKATMGSLKSVLPTDFPSIGVPWLMEALTALYGKARVAERLPQLANVVISNVPGPPVPLYLAGARMLSNWPTSIVAHGLALNITVESYDTQMDFGLVADAAAAPDLRRLAEAIQSAFDELPLLAPRRRASGAAASLPELARSGRKMAGQVVSQVASQMVGSVADGVMQRVGGVVKSAVGAVTQGAVRGALQGVAAARRPKAAATPPPGPAPKAVAARKRAKPAGLR